MKTSTNVQHIRKLARISLKSINLTCTVHTPYFIEINR